MQHVKKWIAVFCTAGMVLAGSCICAHAESTVRTGQMLQTQSETKDSVKFGQMTQTERENEDAVRVGQMTHTQRGTEDTVRTGQILQTEKETEDTQEEIGLEQIGDYIDLSELEAGFAELYGSDSLSIKEMVAGLIRGEIPFEPDKLPGQIAELFLREIRTQKDAALQILIIVLASAVFSNFIRVFENSQIADISYYMIYLLVSTLLVRSFSSMNALVLETCENISDFMKLLLPPYLVTVVLSSGSISAVSFYEITVLAMNLIQGFLIHLVLPAINLYLVLLIVNQMAKEDYFSRLASLIETMVSWIIKTILGVVIGLQTVQSLISPAVDSLKNSTLHRLAKTIPGIGSILDSAAETVAGSAVVIKNAVGVAGMIALVLLCALPFLRLAACIFIFRLLCALIQPVSEKRVVDGIESISRGTVLLLRVLTASMGVFLISLAMITASVKGG